MDAQPLGRSGHMSTFLGKYLIVLGGFSEVTHDDGPLENVYVSTNELWIYDTEFEIWRMLPIDGRTPHFPPGLSGACAVLVDHYLYIYGGHSLEGHYGELHRLDLSSLSWERVPCKGKRPAPRDKFVGWSHEGKLHFFGGFGVPFDEDPEVEVLHDNGSFLLNPGTMFSYQERGWNNQIIIFDPETLVWSNPQYKGEPPSPRAAHAATKIGDKVWMFGGRHGLVRTAELHCLDLKKKTWSGSICAPGLWPCGRTWHSFTAISQRQIFLYGGYTQYRKPLSDGWILDTELLQWTQLDVPGNKPRLWHTACLNNYGEVMVFGGCQKDILDHDDNSDHSKEILTFCFTPPSLVRICIKLAIDHKDILETEWGELPKSLRGLLYSRSVRHRVGEQTEQLQLITHGT
ncbi:PREDICTED: kelch domain-containing protein 2-like [Priapulus caudatus]|uniref:Kelch domain-containing protein 2-like n=1 Tax=Priapulus caudatus TaxID=37621 RepID=A0ABM1E1M9_PRICU|nr:PREDICTED: kelch domain-containing protein 2-like [Priapulus caudatus]